MSLFNEFCCGCAAPPTADGPSTVVQRPSQRIEPLNLDLSDELDGDIPSS